MKQRLLTFIGDKIFLPFFGLILSLSALCYHKKVLVELGIKQNELVVDVVSILRSGEIVTDGQGKVLTDGFENGAITDEVRAWKSLEQCITQAEDNAKVAIRRVSINPTGIADVGKLKALLVKMGYVIEEDNQIGMLKV